MEYREPLEMLDEMRWSLTNESVLCVSASPTTGVTRVICHSFSKGSLHFLI
ncbi:hypothetical protein MOUN0_F06524 [Monosporozyma unispora]